MIETSIERIQGDDYCCVFTAEKKFINKIHDLEKKYPDDVEIHVINKDGSIVAYVPYDWFRFVLPPKRASMTEEQRNQARKRLALARQKKGSNKNGNSST